MTRRAAAKSLSLPFPQPAPASGSRAVPRGARCPGLLADDRGGIIERRRADCAHLLAAEAEWIDGFGSAQAMCPAVCMSFVPRPDESLVVLRRSGGVADGAAVGERKAPKVNKVLGDGAARRCSRCRKNLARSPLAKRWGKKPRYRWCAPCAAEHVGYRSVGKTI